MSNNLYIVDDMNNERTVKHYLSEWCQISKQLDIATGYFELGGLLELDEKWQKPDMVRIIKGSRVLEYDTDVQNWLHPAPQDFNITYNHGHKYEPDFVVETEGVIYLVEVKGEDKLNDPDVIAKEKRCIQYCEVATRWGKANGYKAWRYLFIPSKQVMLNSSFMQLSKQFQTL